jgi:hypothetical protein
MAGIDWPSLRSHILHMYVSSVLDVSDVCCYYFILMLQKYIGGCCTCCICCNCFRGILRAFVQNVSSISRCLLQYFLSRCCICFTHMLRRYISNVSTVSILCCSKWFHVASCKSGRFMCFIHMLQVRVLKVLSTFQTYVVFKCFSCCRYTYMIYI